MATKKISPCCQEATRDLGGQAQGHHRPGSAGRLHWHAPRKAEGDERLCNIPELSACSAHRLWEDGWLLPLVYIKPEKMVACRMSSRASGM